MLSEVWVCNLVSGIPLHAGRRPMAAADVLSVVCVLFFGRWILFMAIHVLDIVGHNARTVS